MRSTCLDVHLASLSTVSFTMYTCGFGFDVSGTSQPPCFSGTGSGDATGSSVPFVKAAPSTVAPVTAGSLPSGSSRSSLGIS